MKVNRHAKIVELINKYQIETQDELAEKLKEAGFDAGNGIQRHPRLKAHQGSGRKRKAEICGTPECTERND